MAEPFIAEIRIFAGSFAPRGWAFCDGQLMSISQNTALFSLLGVAYGGNGTTTFALPDLQGRAAMQWGQGPGLSNYARGEATGSATVTLTQQQMPAHGHPANALPVPARDPVPSSGAALARVQSQAGSPYSSSAPTSTLDGQSVGETGGSMPHNNRQPYLGIHFIIALEGIYPQRQ